MATVIKTAFGFFIAALMNLHAHAAEQVPVDLELVLAVDISRSMDPEERALQRSGYVEALRHPSVAQAVRSGLHGRIALTYFEWSGQWTINTLMDWTLIEGKADLDRVADQLDRQPISIGAGTSITGALVAGARAINENNFTGTRRVIDISGDGPNNLGGPVLAARADAIAKGIVINGLPILAKQPDERFGLDRLDEYYRDCVTGGAGSFVIPVHSFERIGLAVRQKLVTEISSLQPATNDNPLPVIQASTGSDCLIGEKLRNDYMRSIGFD